LNQHLYVLKINNKYGFINDQGDIVVPAVYKSANNFHDGLAQVWTKDNKKGYINSDNKLVIELEADYLDDFKGYLAIISMAGKKRLHK